MQIIIIIKKNPKTDKKPFRDSLPVLGHMPDPEPVAGTKLASDYLGLDVQLSQGGVSPSGFSD